MSYNCWAQPLNVVCVYLFVCVRWHKIPWKATAVIRKQCKTNKYRKNWKARGGKMRDWKWMRVIILCRERGCVSECSRAYRFLFLFKCIFYVIYEMNGKWRQTKGEHHKNRATFANMSMVDGILDGVSCIACVLLCCCCSFCTFCLFSHSFAKWDVALSRSQFSHTHKHDVHTTFSKCCGHGKKTTTEKYPIQAMEWLQ